MSDSWIFASPQYIIGNNIAAGLHLFNYNPEVIAILPFISVDINKVGLPVNLPDDILDTAGDPDYPVIHSGLFQVLAGELCNLVIGFNRYQNSFRLKASCKAYG